MVRDKIFCEFKIVKNENKNTRLKNLINCLLLTFYWEIMNITSIANGLMESVLERRMETIRPENEKSKSFINKQEIRIDRTIKWIENNWHNYNNDYLTMDQITIACALDYTIFRFNNKWKSKNKKINEWFEKFIKKDFMKNTKPYDK